MLVERVFSAWPRNGGKANLVTMNEPPLPKISLTPEQESELSMQRSLHFETRRATVVALEELLYKPFAVLDHGFVRVVDYMGDDSAVVQAARVSYGTGTK